MRHQIRRILAVLALVAFATTVHAQTSSYTTTIALTRADFERPLPVIAQILSPSLDAALTSLRAKDVAAQQAENARPGGKVTVILTNQQYWDARLEDLEASYVTQAKALVAADPVHKVVIDAVADSYVKAIESGDAAKLDAIRKAAKVDTDGKPTDAAIAGAVKK